MNMEYFLYGITIISLVILGAVSGKSVGAGVMKPIIRIVIWGIIAMAVSTFVGYLFSVNV
jgi:VIT1/CCC1 family predicted Fe2+/Mn2+ transporter